MKEAAPRIGKIHLLHSSFNTSPGLRRPLNLLLEISQHAFEDCCLLSILINAVQQLSNHLSLI